MGGGDKTVRTIKRLRVVTIHPQGVLATAYRVELLLEPPKVTPPYVHWTARR